MPGYGPYDVRCGGAISRELQCHLGSDRTRRRVVYECGPVRQAVAKPGIFLRARPQ